MNSLSLFTLLLANTYSRSYPYRGQYFNRNPSFDAVWKGKMCLNPMHIDHQDYVGVNKFTFFQIKAICKEVEVEKAEIIF